jgi:uncharacterized cupredoxin-like copper-binding protein
VGGATQVITARYYRAMPEGGWGTGSQWARLSSLIGLAALSAVLGASCGRSVTPEPSASSTEKVGSPAAQPLVIVMSEFSFTVEGPPPPPGYPRPTATLQSGSSVLVTLRNVGRIAHHWSVGRTLLPGGGYEHDLLAKMKPEVLSGTGYRLVKTGPAGVIIEVDSGGAVTVRLTVPADATGTWDMACFVPGHYAAGMHAPLIVK